jgi:hypothetical protein
LGSTLAFAIALVGVTVFANLARQASGELSTGYEAMAT